MRCRRCDLVTSPTVDGDVARRDAATRERVLRAVRHPAVTVRRCSHDARSRGRPGRALRRRALRVSARGGARRAGEAHPAHAASARRRAAPGALDQDLPRLAQRATTLYQEVASAFATAGVDCAAATARLVALQQTYADVIAANAKILHDGRARELRAALEPHAEALDARPRRSSILRRCPSARRTGRSPTRSTRWSARRPEAPRARPDCVTFQGARPLETWMRISPLLVFLLTMVSGCAEDPRQRPLTWSYLHAAIIAPSCATASCHSSRAATAGLTLDDADEAYDSCSRATS